MGQSSYANAGASVEWGSFNRGIESGVNQSCGPEITKQVGTTSRVDCELNVSARLKC